MCRRVQSMYMISILFNVHTYFPVCKSHDEERVNSLNNSVRIIQKWVALSPLNTVRLEFILCPNCHIQNSNLTWNVTEINKFWACFISKYLRELRKRV